MEFLVDKLEIPNADVQLLDTCVGCQGTCEGSCEGTCESGCGSGCGSK